MAKLADRIEIFRAGTFRPMTGDDRTFSDDDVRDIADGYDPAAFASPIVVGHPSHDSPAFGWIKGLSVEGGRLVASLADVTPAFADAVAAGNYRKVSSAFFPPDHPANPKPGQWYLRHVGFLGGAAPAVPDLKPVTAAFASAVGIVEFASDLPYAASALGRIIANLREWFIEKEGREEADKVIPSWEVDSVQEHATAAIRETRDDPIPAPSFSTSEPTKEPSDMPVPDTTADLAAREAALTERETKLALAECAAFVDGLVAEGRVLPAERDETVAFMAALPDTDAETVAFAATDGKPVKKSLRASFRDQLAARPKAVMLDEIAKASSGPDAPTVAFATPDGFGVDPEGLAIHTKALAYQAEHGGEYVDAVRAVSR